MGRVDGRLERLGDKIVTSEACLAMGKDLMRRESDEPLAEFTKELTVETPSARWRVSLFRAVDGWRVAARRLKETPPSLFDLGFPPEMVGKMFGGIQEGLVVLAGPTGAGKTTTCMSAVQEILRRRAVHVVTIEDPVEYLLEDGRGLVSQREAGRHVESFAAGLKDALRQDPDVIVPGEARDSSTCETALQAAETGHLVFTTVHAATLEEAVGRLVAMHPDPDTARRQLASCLRLLVVQRLVRREEGGMALSFKAVRGTDAVRHVIAEGREKDLDNEALMQRLCVETDQ